MSTNIDLEKHGLKEVKFSELIDGEEFNIPEDFYPGLSHGHEFFRRKIVGDDIIYADGSPIFHPETVAMHLALDTPAFVKA